MISLKSQKGFTLIELLIVIVIIGILAGVLIAVIDPASQQNKARDANVQATINKIALAIGGFNSAYGRAPDGDEISNLLNGWAAAPTADANCTTASSTSCRFTMANTPLPPNGATAPNNINGCAASPNNYFGNGAQTNQCAFRYERGTTAATLSDFKIFAKSYGIGGQVFKYDSTTSRIHQCDGTSAAAADCTT